MVGNIIHKGNNEKEYPLVLTEAEFLEILNKGIYTYNLLGHQVTLSNSAATSGTNPNYMIIDINHDSIHTEQTNCYDLMAVDCVGQQVFNTFANQYWISSNCKTWLNGTYYNGFSNNFKSHIMGMKYTSNGTWYNDYIILPSMTELTRDMLNTSGYLANEGVAYPLLSYQVKNTNSVNTDYWWTRSRSLTQSSHVWKIFKTGDPSILVASYGTGGGMSPIFRVH